MKVKLYFGNIETIKKSGIGKALEHQKKALALNNVEVTTEKKDKNYDILHINTVFPDSFDMINQAHKIGAKVIYHAHSTKEDFRDSFMLSNYVSGAYKSWLVNLYKKADFIITPTPYSKELLRSYEINLPIEAISNGVDLSKFSPNHFQIEAFCEAYNIKPDDVIIISVGWLFERKGFDTFVETAIRLPQYKFIWFGDKKLSNPTANIKKILRELPENVILPGYISGDVFMGAYGRSNVFFFPSREETEGIVVLEALACRTQVLVRDIPVFDTWLTDKENCYKGRDVNEFVDIIQKIVNHEYPSTIEAGYQVAKDRDLKKIGEELVRVYQKVLES